MLFIPPRSVGALGPVFDDGEPEILDQPNDVRELVEVHRLADVCVGVEIVRADDVLLRLRRGQHDHGDPTEVGVRLHLGQDPSFRSAAASSGRGARGRDEAIRRAPPPAGGTGGLAPRPLRRADGSRSWTPEGPLGSGGHRRGCPRPGGSRWRSCFGQSSVVTPRGDGKSRHLHDRRRSGDEDGSDISPPLSGGPVTRFTGPGRSGGRPDDPG
jgi:hypothetical protein